MTAPYPSFPSSSAATNPSSGFVERLSDEANAWPQQARLLAREAGWRGYNALRLIVGLAMLVVLESYSAWYAYAAAPQMDLWPTPFGEVPRAALFHGALSTGFGLLAFMALLAAGNLAADERPRIRAGATFATILGLLAMLIPVGNLGSAMDFDHQLAHWEQIRSGPEFQVSLAIATDPGADSREQRLAAEKLTKPAAAEFNPLTWMMAAFFHGVVAFFARVRMAPPITPAEREAMARERRAQLEEQKRGARNELIRRLHKDGCGPAEIAARLQELGYEGVTRAMVSRVVAQKRAPAKTTQKQKPKPLLGIVAGGRA